MGTFMGVQVSTEARGIGSLGAEVRSNCELTKVGAGNPVLVVCKSCLGSQPLSPLSSPGLVFHISRKTTELSCPYTTVPGT